MIIKKRAKQKEELIQTELENIKNQQEQSLLADSSVMEPHSEIKTDVAQNTEQEKKETERIFDIENFDFSIREERRRGDRRRGYRRTDERALISRAQESAEEIKKNAFEEGYKEGIAKAHEDLKALNDELKKFMGAKQAVFEYIAPDIVEIAVDIAKKIIKKEVSEDPQIVLGMVLDVMNTLPRDVSKITVKVHPEMIETVNNGLTNLIYQSQTDAKINVIPDETIDDGGCIIISNNGIIDATINTQIEIIQEVLKGIR